jgi:hypothetical protein
LIETSQAGELRVRLTFTTSSQKAVQIVWAAFLFASKGSAMVKRVSATTAKKMPVKKTAAKKASAKKTVGKKMAARKAPMQWSDESRELFLSTLAETANVAEAARVADMSRTAAYAERRRNKAFAQSWSAAMEQALDELEMAVLERATHGYDKDVVYQGNKTDKVRLYSDGLAMFLLRAHRPQTYCKSGQDGTPVLANVDDIRSMIAAKLSDMKDEAI